MATSAGRAGVFWALLGTWLPHGMLAASAGSEASGQPRHVYIGIGATPKDGDWIREQQKSTGAIYRPVLIQPHPRWAEGLRGLAQEMGGTFYPNAAWSKDGGRLRLNMATDPIYATGLDSLFHVRGRHDASINVTTVDLARVFEEHTDPGDVVVMRMDVEGSEYNLLRHLLLHGLLCRLSKLYLEAHAMSQPKLNDLRTFDVLLPWLLEPCGTEVFVDSNYHSLYESRQIWPIDDGGCRYCPLLYVPLPGVNRDRCPAAALSACFDDEFTCERCCSQRKGARGDQSCWSRGRTAAEGKQLGTGGHAWPLPEAVLDRIRSRWSGRGDSKVSAIAGPEAGSPKIFSYEMCCAGMVSLLKPELTGYVAELFSNEAFTYAPQQPVSALVEQATAAELKEPEATHCEDVSGLWEDSGAGVVSVSQVGCNITAANNLQRWHVSGTAIGKELHLWTMAGVLTQDAVTWPNGQHECVSSVRSGSQAVFSVRVKLCQCLPVDQANVVAEDPKLHPLDLSKALGTPAGETDPASYGIGATLCDDTTPVPWH
ncbi:unnamed protein product [Polarella glacialis]|uniref:Methyltransferase FkbM domain-containing protein n=1 Tax=Polarella glacialis TaxID=89957 RepID=A0A813GV75_POLGL|nr:unnamed protein product [Polarella glacialis]